MKILKNKTTTVFAMLLALTFAVSLIALPIANAHTPVQTVPTFAYIAIAPDPVGVDQAVLLVMWVSPNPPTAAGLGGDRWRDMTVKVTDPNGGIENLGPFTSDPTGSTFASYTPDQVGTYKFEFNFPGQTLLPYNPDNNIPGFPSPFVNDTFLASSVTEFLTVQQDAIPKIPDYPLPTSFWTRPIEGQNAAWYSLESNWLQGGHLGASGFNPYKLWQKDGVAPNSPHIMWTMPTQMGGIAGGTTEIAETGFYSGGSYEGRFANAIIMYGILYYNLPLNHEGGNGGYVAVDLRTGEQKWFSDQFGVRKPPILNQTTGAILDTGVYPAPAFGQLFEYESINQHGVIGGILWQTSSVGVFPNAYTVWQAFDAYTGKWLYNLTSIPAGTEVYTKAGEIVRYVLNYNTTARNGWLALWNNTQDRVGLHLANDFSTNAYQWRPNGKVVNMSNAYSWNVTISGDLSGLNAPAILNVIPGDIILGKSTTLFNLFGELFGDPTAGRQGTQNPYTFWAISDKPESRGQLLWIKNFTAPVSGVTRSQGWGNPIDEVNRVFFTTDLETFQWQGYDLDTGEMLWETNVQDFRALQYYGSGLGGGQVGACGEGKLFVQGFGGDLYAYNTLTGDVLWKYNNTNSGDETVWGQYPIFIGAIADGKVYAFNNEHSPNYPLYKGERVRCINATTGEEIWTMLGWAGQTGGPGSATMVVAGGSVVYYNYYDNQVYVIGKGPSATTVTASPKVTVDGDEVLIEGMVTDQSPGAKDRVQKGLFNMVPAVSDESMGPWMEYIYMQKPMPTDATGVTVLLQTLDPNGNFYDIGTVTTDSNGMYKLMWKPPVPGEYTIIATFQGSESYWPSYSESALGVSQAPEATPGPTPPPGSNTDTYVLGSAIGVIIAIGIIGFLILRKH